MHWRVCWKTNQLDRLQVEARQRVEPRSTNKLIIFFISNRSRLTLFDTNERINTNKKANKHESRINLKICASRKFVMNL